MDPRNHNMADALTKSSPVLSAKLNVMLKSGIWDEMIESVIDSR